MTVAVLTLAHGRHDHLRGQIAGLAAGRRRPDLHVVAAMGDPAVAQVARDAWTAPTGDHPDVPAPHPAVDLPAVDLHVVDLPADPLGLPLAAARNAAARRAIEAGADHLVLLDVDCIPGPTTVATYAAALETPHTDPAPRVLGGDVAYLPPLPAGRAGWTRPEDLARLPEAGEHRPDRVRLTPGQQRREPDLNRFWSLSFALTAEDLERTGGFCEDYVGYGGEDTDFAQVVGARGGSLVWLGGATAYHQHHDSTSPPVQHLEAIVRNAAVFHRRWGWWPMEGWLVAFAERGLVERGADGSWRLAG